MPDIHTKNMFSCTLEDALKGAIAALGGAKKVGAIFKPDIESVDAANWLNNCLNPHKRDKLGPSQIMFILREARKIGHHGAINFICEDTGYTAPTPIEPETEEAALMREFNQHVKLQAELLDRIERVAQRRSSAMARSA